MEHHPLILEMLNHRDESNSSPCNLACWEKLSCRDATYILDNYPILAFAFLHSLHTEDLQELYGLFKTTPCTKVSSLLFSILARRTTTATPHSSPMTSITLLQTSVTARITNTDNSDLSPTTLATHTITDNGAASKGNRSTIPANADGSGASGMQSSHAPPRR